MNRCVIVCAGPIEKYEVIRKYLKSDDFYVFCDGGLKHSKGLEVKPSLIVGDFDSFDKEMLSDNLLLSFPVETIKLPCEKDDTDSFYAIKECLKRGYSDFLIVGAIGNRFDHSLCNISALIYLKNHGAKASIIDDFSEMEIIGNGDNVQIPDSYSYFSLMNVAGDVSGVNISGAKYPLKNSEIKAEYSYGISNEVLPGSVANVSVEKGLMLLVKVL